MFDVILLTCWFSLDRADSAFRSLAEIGLLQQTMIAIVWAGSRGRPVVG